MTTSSARPLDLLDYMASTGAQHDAMPSTRELDRLVGVMMREPNVEFFNACYLLPGDRVVEARQLAQELDSWVGIIATGFMEADGGEDPDQVVTVDDTTVIDALPPFMADPPGEIRARVEEGQQLYDELAEASEDRDHDRIEAIMAEIEERADDDPFMAGLATRIADAGGEDTFEEMITDGMRPKDREGFLGGVVDFFAGAWDAVWGTVTFLWDISTVRMIIDNEGWRESVGALGRGVWEGITNPTEFLKAIIDLDGLKDNPERWFGALAPDAVLAYFTAGTGTAARRGVGATRALRRLGDYVISLRRLRGLDVPGGGMGVRIRGFNRLLDQFDGDIDRARDAMRTNLTRGGLSSAAADRIVNLLSGNAFNAQRRGHGTQLAEVELGPRGTHGVRVDAWDPVEGEIISRKYTQLADLTPRAARDYLDELAAKYAPGTEIKLTPTVRRKAEQAGLDPDSLPTELGIDDDLVLEVPPQTRAGDIPQSVFDRADEMGITIRQTDGVVLS